MLTFSSSHPSPTAWPVQWPTPTVIRTPAVGLLSRRFTSQRWSQIFLNPDLWPHFTSHQPPTATTSNLDLTNYVHPHKSASSWRHLFSYQLPASCATHLVVHIFYHIAIASPTYIYKYIPTLPSHLFISLKCDLFISMLMNIKYVCF